MLLDDFAGIPAALEVLHKWFDVDAIDRMVQEQPLFLVEDVEDAISSLNRFDHLHLLPSFSSLAKAALCKSVGYSCLSKMIW